MFQIIQEDPWLQPYAQAISARHARFQQCLNWIEASFGSLSNYANQHQELGLQYNAQEKSWTYKEWAPNAEALFLTGDFNDWNQKSHPLKKETGGIWTLELPSVNGQSVLKHQSKINVIVEANGQQRWRIPAYITRAIQNTETNLFQGQIWNPETPFAWTDQNFKWKDKAILVYECHVGMAQEKEGLGTYLEFAEHILPRIKALGYNCIQLMAVQEHPYYGSFGYHVSNYFAPSSRFGTPEDLKALIDKAHGMGIAVVLDIVHSHAVKNIEDGLNDFDGSGHQYFHEGERGHHPAWDSKIFDYGKDEVRRFLLSNLRYWLEEFHFDGFRFDGITSMLYHHHGHFVAFDHYDKYFLEGVEFDAVMYCQLANTLIKTLNPNALSIAEDMSGMPGLCRPIDQGGMGFDYRLGMGIPDFWIKLLKHEKDENWNVRIIWEMMVNRRHLEKTIAYAESHDQAMVGDKTVAFWLMDKEMYDHMKKEDPSLIIDRGIALHKLIRLTTIALGGDAYLNFIGNEFGHPEWIDFPREGNNWSYKYARRQWSLVDHPELKFEWLNNFDQAMIQFFATHQILEDSRIEELNIDTDNQILIFKRKGLIFIISFNPSNSIADYKFDVSNNEKYKIVLNSDHKNFGGFERVDESVEFPVVNGQISIYIPNRCAIVLGEV